MALTKYKLGDLIEAVDERNSDLKYRIDSVRGISNTKEIMLTKADVTEKVIQKFYIVEPNQFIYNPRTTRMGSKVGLAYNNTNLPLLFSFNNVAFKIKKDAKKIISPIYLYMFFNRNEFDRYAIMNSWGSATELFSWTEMCDIEINLPSLEIQKKFVAIYDALLANQKNYEHGLDDLKLVCDGYFDKIKHTMKKIPLSEIIEEIDERNSANKYKIAHGINITKNFMPSVASSDDLSKYKIVYRNQFVCSLMRVGRDEIIPVALNDGDIPIIVSPAYIVFEIKSTKMLPQYLFMWLSRSEIDRRAVFMSDTSIRSGVEKKRFFEIEVPVPDIEIQKSIASIYEVYQSRKKILEKLKAQIKNICPILIKGSLDEGKMC